MRATEFEAGWGILQAALPQVELPEATRALYVRALADLPDGAFRAGILSLITSPDFNPLRVPTLAELREECAAKAAVAPGVPHVAGVRLTDYLRDVEASSGPVARTEAGAVVAAVARRALEVKPSEPGPENTGHGALLRGAGAAPILPAASLSDEEWEARRRALLEQAGAAEMLDEARRPPPL